MTKDKSIFIHNVYYMLSYAFQALKKNTYENIDKEDFELIQDLFAEILYRAVSLLVKQGLFKEYVEKHDTLPLIKGKIDINGTIKNRIRRNNLVACEFDELSEDNVFNQIIKTTIGILVREKTVDRQRKNLLRGLLPFFDNVKELNPFLIHWSTLKFQRGNQTYRMVINLCYFILNGMLMTTEAGKYRMATFSDEHMNRLYEKFVLEYFRKHHPDLHAHADQLPWDIDEGMSAMLDFLPTMQSDITLYKENRVLIIDTKYYGHAMQEQYGKKSLHSGNMYQIFTYVKNKDKDNSGNVSGMLLYAKTDEDIAPKFDAVIKGNRFLVDTLDLNVEFTKIAAQLDNIAHLLD